MKKTLIIRLSFCVYIFLLFPFVAYSQSIEEKALQHNSLLGKKSQAFRSSASFRSSSTVDTINLGPKGIVEDFSYAGPYPDTSLWLDSMVFINRGFGIAPPSIGVATFDGLDAYGFPYDFYNTSTASGSADTLTSKPINLNYTLNNILVDSIYLSFYYQRQGLGNNPEVDDSLVLELKAPGTSSPWVHVWSKEGIASPVTDSAWGRVMIAINNASFLKKGFQFRFRNYASRNASADHWNIDNVYLNITRTISDTLTNDVAWVYNGRSLLKKYRAMPWRQYNPAELNTSVGNLIRNNDSIIHNVNYKYKVFDGLSSPAIDSFAGASNIYPFSKNRTYTDCQIPLGCISSAAVNTSKFPLSLTGPTQLSIMHYFSSSMLGDFSVKNDTLKVFSQLSNYFAYDDGAAESEVGLVNAMDGKLAVKFTLNVPDTLCCMDIYFNPFMENANLYSFYMNVWEDAGGIPGAPVYTGYYTLTPEYTTTGLNAFTRYYTDAPMLLAAGTYYVGFTQKTTSPIYVGLDKNNNAQSQTFYNVGSGWSSLPFYGALMIHPVFGNIHNPTGINDEMFADNTIAVYPNPANNVLFIKSAPQGNALLMTYEVTDVYGHVVLQGATSVDTPVDIAALAPGVYLIKVNNVVKKFIKIN